MNILWDYWQTSVEAGTERVCVCVCVCVCVRVRACACDAVEFECGYFIIHSNSWLPTELNS